ncbi:MAG: B12-binding domain-containing radical SAM protein [Lachnospiraceae bacterium]|nr:B12-binding domain-containing radical SAM protein [Lachnospiraceae bacterium]
MKFLLTAVNAKYIHTNPALYSLRAHAGTAYRPYIEIAEYTINNQMEDILNGIYEKAPDVLGFSCYIWNWRVIKELIVEIHKLLPQVPIWLGGPEVSYQGEKILTEFPFLAGIMVGEGEQTFLELMRYYCREEKTVGAGRDLVELEEIPGLLTAHGFTAPRAITNLTTLPFLYENLDDFENKILYYESSRGCPFRCSYCLSSIDKTVRLRSLETVKKELQFFLDNNVKQVKFIDRTFNSNHEHAMGIWQYILEHDNGVTNFHFEIEAELLREDELRLLKKLRPGLVQMEIGVQTANPETLKEVHRTPDLSRLEATVASLREGKNIHIHLDLIAGLPFEDYESFGHSFDRVYRMKPEQLQLGFLKVLSGSEMCARQEEYGIKALDNPPYEVLSTNWLPHDKIISLKRIEEMIELYYNSCQYTHTLPILEQVFSTPFAMYEALADFYRENGFFVNSPSRMYRYEVLLQFARTVDLSREELYCEQLTYDMYLRENLKSRPDFSGVLEEKVPGWKDRTKEFYRNEEQKRQCLPAYREYDARQLEKMTHLEPFYYVQKKTEWIKTDIPQLVLFDYKERNPLNQEARTIWL